MSPLLVAPSNIGELEVACSAVTENFATRGGGIFNINGVAKIKHSTISSNRALGAAGASAMWALVASSSPRAPLRSIGATSQEAVPKPNEQAGAFKPMRPPPCG